jgi:hypothetical protein
MLIKFFTTLPELRDSKKSTGEMRGRERMRTRDL